MKFRKRQQAGAVMVEMVAVTPLLLLLLLGVGEIGKALIEYNTLNKSVREAAPELLAEGQNLVVYGNIAGGGEPRLLGLTIDNVSVIDAGDNLVLIQASYPYVPLMGPVLETFGYGTDPATDGIRLTASVVMRAL
jgi:hypothetical protein